MKTGVIKQPRDGETVLNNAYRQLTAHYSAAVLPGRIRRPKDKSSGEYCRPCRDLGHRGVR